MDQASREIMGNLPDWFGPVMYALFLIAVGIMVKGLYEKYQFVTGGKGVKDLLPKKLQWGSFFKNIILTGKVPRRKGVAAFHSLIFYGFVILWIATDLVAIHYDTPLKIFQGTTYIVISFLADIGGLTILIGIAFAYWRRYVKKTCLSI